MTGCELNGYIGGYANQGFILITLSGNTGQTEIRLSADAHCDGVINAGDVEPFVFALLDSDACFDEPFQ